jgi:hypothetical protein
MLLLSNNRFLRFKESVLLQHLDENINKIIGININNLFL